MDGKIKKFIYTTQGTKENIIDERILLGFFDLKLRSFLRVNSQTRNVIGHFLL